MSRFLIAVLLSSLCTGLQADLYRWVDENGIIHYSDRKVSGAEDDYKPESSLSTFNSILRPATTGAGPGKKSGNKKNSGKKSPDLHSLMAVPFPARPDDESVAAYINTVYNLSKDQTEFKSGDPQVTLLQQVGQEFLPILIRETNSAAGWHFYGLEAIGRLVTRRHQPQIFRAFKSNPGYVRIIYLKGWHFELQKPLIDGLRNRRGSIPRAWISAIAEFNRDDARSVLIDYFKSGKDNHLVYEVTANLPHMSARVETALPAAWETAKIKNPQALDVLTPAVLDLGYRPAFEFVMNSLIGVGGQALYSLKAHVLALSYTEQTGTAAEIFAWFQSYKDRISFDSEKRLFLVSN